MCQLAAEMKCSLELTSLAGLRRSKWARIEDGLDGDDFSILYLVPGREERCRGLRLEIVENTNVISIHKHFLQIVVSLLLLHHGEKLFRAAKSFTGGSLHADIVSQEFSDFGVVTTIHGFDIRQDNFSGTLFRLHKVLLRFGRFTPLHPNYCAGLRLHP